MPRLPHPCRVCDRVGILTFDIRPEQTASLFAIFERTLLELVCLRFSKWFCSLKVDDHLQAVEMSTVTLIAVAPVPHDAVCVLVDCCPGMQVAVSSRDQTVLGVKQLWSRTLAGQGVVVIHRAPPARDRGPSITCQASGTLLNASHCGADRRADRNRSAHGHAACESRRRVDGRYCWV
jgi:hypothetical protein